MATFKNILNKFVRFIVNPMFLYIVVALGVIIAIIGAIFGYGALWTFLVKYVLLSVGLPLIGIGGLIIIIYALIINPINAWREKKKNK